MDDNNQYIYLLTKIHDKVEKVDERLDTVDKTLIKQEENLKEHMKRTDLNEEHLELFKQKVENDLAPILEHVGFIKALGKLSTIVMGIAVFVSTVLGIIFFFKG